MSMSQGFCLIGDILTANMKNILITGGAGFIGSHVVRLFVNKYPEYKDQIVIGTFNDEIEAELKTKYPDLLRGAPTGSAASFILTQMLWFIRT